MIKCASYLYFSRWSHRESEGFYWLRAWLISSHVTWSGQPSTFVESATTIQEEAFSNWRQLVSVSMHANVKRIECQAFSCCRSLVFIGLSRRVECTGFGIWFPLLLFFGGSYSFFRHFERSAVLSFANADHWRSSSCQEISKLETWVLLLSLDAIGYRLAAGQGNPVHIGMGWSIVCYIIINNGEAHTWTWLVHRYDKLPFHGMGYDASISSRMNNDYLHWWPWG